MNSSHVFVADFGGNSWTVYDSLSKEIFSLSPEEFFSLSFLPAGSTLISEQAHLGSPRNDKSLAQVYTAAELSDLYSRAKAKRCIVKLFPQSCTAKARAKHGTTKKTDEVDVKAIYDYVVNSPHMPLMNPPSSFVASAAREAGWSFKDETNGILNKARRFKYQDSDDAVVQFIDSHLEQIASRLSPMAKKVFVLDQRKQKGGFYASQARTSRLYTIASLFLHPDGSLRQRPDTGAMPGIQWLKKHVIHMSPFHFRGGIARSNLYWHGQRNYVIGEMDTRKASTNGKVLSHYDFTPEQDRIARAHRKDYSAAIIEAMRIVRDLVAQG
jgi:hypothetical protein